MYNEKQKQLIAEVKRLAGESPSGTCTRNYFRNNSDYTEHVVKREFGNFTELLRSASMRPGRLDASYNNRRALLQTEAVYSDYFKKCVEPWTSEIQEVDANKVTMIIASDFHGEHASTFALEVFLDVVRTRQPEHVVFNGDLVNFEPVGRWSKNPNRLLDLQSEIDFSVEEILEKTREAAPDAIIDFITGNHEMWLQRYLAEQAPGLASLRCLSFGELFNLDELNIGLVHGGDLLAPSNADKKSLMSNAYKVYYDTFVVTHGTSTGPSAASTELNRFKMSGCSGHLHRPSCAYGSSLDRRYIDWHVTPKMTEDTVAEQYGKGLPLGWFTGFSIVEIFPETKTHFYQDVLMKDGICNVNGVTYYDTTS